VKEIKKVTYRIANLMNIQVAPPKCLPFLNKPHPLKGKKEAERGTKWARKDCVLTVSPCAVLSDFCLSSVSNTSWNSERRRELADRSWTAEAACFSLPFSAAHSFALCLPTTQIFQFYFLFAHFFSTTILLKTNILFNKSCRCRKGWNCWKEPEIELFLLLWRMGKICGKSWRPGNIQSTSVLFCTNICKATRESSTQISKCS